MYVLGEEREFLSGLDFLILALPHTRQSEGMVGAAELRALNDRLTEDLRARSVRRRIRYHGTGWIEYDEFYPRGSKAILDEIDLALARHYGFTDEELDCILNYDVKFRMGREG